MTDPTPDAAKLLPCPFCGSAAEVERHYRAISYDPHDGLGHSDGGVMDETPYCQNAYCRAYRPSVEAWNTRAPAAEDGWRLAEKQPPTEADGLFLAFVPPCIMGCSLVENGKIVWPREGESEQANGVTHWRPLPAPPKEKP